MKKFKKIDFWISTILLITGVFIFAVIIFLDGSVNSIIYLLVCFFVGLWHVLSMIVHLFSFNNWQYKIIRLTYTLISAFILSIAFTSSFMDSNYIYLLPAMAIFYTALCGVEIYKKPAIENE